MKIEINSREYHCWHELGYAMVCIHLGGNVEFIELLDDESLGGLARARLETTPDIRQLVTCGGFAAEFFLLRSGHLGQVNEKEFIQIIFGNAWKDRQMFHGRPSSSDESFTKAEDEAFMNAATRSVWPIIRDHETEIRVLVKELLAAGKIDNRRLKEILAEH